MLLRLIYASRIARPTIEDLDQTLSDIQRVSLARNRDANLTSLLTARQAWFLQAIEGPPEAVRILYGAIQRDGRHTGVQVLSEETPSSRQFGRWNLAVRALSARDAAALTALDGGKAFDPVAAHRRVITRLLTVIAEAHADKFDRQQRLAVA